MGWGMDAAEGRLFFLGRRDYFVSEICFCSCLRFLLSARIFRVCVCFCLESFVIFRSPPPHQPPGPAPPCFVCQRTAPHGGPQDLGSRGEEGACSKRSSPVRAEIDMMTVC